MQSLCSSWCFNHTQKIIWTCLLQCSIGVMAGVSMAFGVAGQSLRQQAWFRHKRGRDWGKEAKRGRVMKWGECIERDRNWLEGEDTTRSGCSSLGALNVLEQPLDVPRLALLDHGHKPQSVQWWYANKGSRKLFSFFLSSSPPLPYTEPSQMITPGVSDNAPKCFQKWKIVISLPTNPCHNSIRGFLGTGCCTVK